MQNSVEQSQLFFSAPVRAPNSCPLRMGMSPGQPGVGLPVKGAVVLPLEKGTIRT